MGAYTTNSHFYKPAAEESQAVGLSLFDAALDAADAIIHGVYEAHTGDDTLTHAESGSIHSNLGAIATVTLDLPQDATAGCKFTFVNLALQEFRIAPGAAGGIHINGVQQANDKYITVRVIEQSGTLNESVMLVADGNGNWIALFKQGTFYIQP